MDSSEPLTSHRQWVYLSSEEPFACLPSNDIRKQFIVLLLPILVNLAQLYLVTYTYASVLTFHLLLNDSKTFMVKGPTVEHANL